MRLDVTTSLHFDMTRRCACTAFIGQGLSSNDAKWFRLFQVRWPPDIQSHISTRPRRPEHPDARHECEVCGRKFTDKRNLREHLRTVHSADGPRYECDVCGKKFTHKRNLSRHLGSVHSVDGPSHECGVCGKKFTQKGSLSQHLRTVHSSDGPAPYMN